MDEIWYGSFIGGARYRIRNTIARIPLYSIGAPNKLIFARDPKLAIGDKIVIDLPDGIEEFTRSWNGYLTVTGVATTAEGLYTVETDGDWIELQQIIFDERDCCGTNMGAYVNVCGALPAPNSLTGIVYSRPLNGNACLLNATIASGSPTLTIDSCMDVWSCFPKKGDAIELEKTAIVGANKARIVEVAKGRTNSGGTRTIVTLDRQIGGITAQLDNGVAKVTATISPAIAANLTFIANGGWEIIAQLPPNISNLPSFDSGRKHPGGGRAYNFTISGNLPHRLDGFINGTLILN